MNPTDAELIGKQQFIQNMLLHAWMRPQQKTAMLNKQNKKNHNNKTCAFTQYSFTINTLPPYMIDSELTDVPNDKHIRTHAEFGSFLPRYHSCQTEWTRTLILHQD